MYCLYRRLFNSQKNKKEELAMSKIKRVFYCNEPEGAEIDCPDCGSDAIMTDDGIVCSNEDCVNS